jgi:hypothetical protein
MVQHATAAVSIAGSMLLCLLFIFQGQSVESATRELVRASI